MGRRANNEGSVFQRTDGRWAATVSVGNGKRKSYYGKTREEVAHKLTSALKAHLDGLPLVGERQTVGQYLGSWLEAIRPTLRPESYRRYEEIVRLHITPQVGKMALARLGPQHLQRLYASRLETGLSATSVQLVHGVLHKALEYCIITL